MPATTLPPAGSLKHRECFFWKDPAGCYRGDTCPYAHCHVPADAGKGKGKKGKPAAAAAGAGFLCFGITRTPQHDAVPT
eukprot:9318223-Heterocapsa_arctica.AAC.1